jgi:hypothetical protein
MMDWMSESDIQVTAGETYYFDVGGPQPETNMNRLIYRNIGTPLADKRRSFLRSGLVFNVIEPAAGAAQVEKLSVNGRSPR